MSDVKALFGLIDKRNKRRLIGAVICCVLSVLCGILPYLGVWGIVTCFLDERTENLFQYVCLIAAAIILKHLLFGTGTKISHKVAYQTLGETRKKLFRKIARLPMGYVKTTASDRYEATLTNWSMGYKICLNLGLFLSLGVGIAMVRSGSLAPATYLFFAIMGIIFYRPLEALMGSFAMMNLANASLDNIAEINNLPTENEKQGTTQFADTQADVRFENVSFSYDGKRDAVSHVSFSAKPGTITALVGPSGSGKSTLLNLIPGFVTPKNGRILLNWKDAATLKHSDLVRHVSVVFQEVYLFQDTMMNNIRMGNQSATDEQVVEAAKKAHCHEFIEKLPQGYQTVISEGGASLSGGERQRVAIARAILKDSPIILLDEALSSLDAENAVAIQKGIEEMIKGKTVFLVSHTLSYIQNSDQILVLSDGILQGCGKHEELLQTVPLYQTMWEKEKSIKNWKLA